MCAKERVALGREQYCGWEPVGDMAAVVAALDMATERRRAAALDRRHHLELAEAQMAGLGTTPGRPVGTEDIRDLQSRAVQTHRRVTPAAGPSW